MNLHLAEISAARDPQHSHRIRSRVRPDRLGRRRRTCASERQYHGVQQSDFPLLGKWLQILKDIVPSVTRVGVMISTVNAASPHRYRLFDSLAPSVGITPVANPIREVAEIEQAV